MNRLADAGRSAAAAFFKQAGRVASSLQETTRLPADILESDDAYLVIFDAPGVTASDVQVRYRNGAIEIRVDRFREHFDGFEMRYPGRGLSLDGRVRLPEGVIVNPDAATATLRENGTLEIHLPKAAVASDHTDVTVEEAAAQEGPPN